MLYFITGNKHKISSAKLYLDTYNISFISKSIPLVEIQSHSIEEIAKHKAISAYEKVKKPLVVKDDGWEIEALNGFPGPYMRYINEWFTTKDFISLLENKTNKNVYFHEVLCFVNQDVLKIFKNRIKGEILNKPQGSALPFMELSTFRKDKKSVAQANNENLPEFENRTVWKKFAEWYKSYIN